MGEDGLGNRCQIEVDMLEKNDTYVHVAVAISDNSFFRSMFPLSTSFLVYKDGRIDA